jgi:HEAT repeat protein
MAPQNRKFTMVLAVLALSAGGMQAQGREIPSRIPMEPLAAKVGAERLATLMRLLQHGSGSDRAATRAELVSILPSVRAEVEAELSRANQFVQTQLILVHMAEGSAPDVLRRLAAGDVRGERGLASLALAVAGQERDVVHVLAATNSAHAEDRRKALLALGRLRGPEATVRLVQEVRSGKELDRLTGLLGLALAMHRPAVADLNEVLAAREDRVRQAAVLVAANARGSANVDMLKRALLDENQLVRRMALEGLAEQSLEAADIAALQAHGKRLPEGADLERARWLLALCVHGVQENVVMRDAADPSADVRLRLVAAASALWHPESLRWSQQLLADSDERVRAVALIAFAHAAPVNETFLLHAQDRAELVRTTALRCHVWRCAGDPRAGLARLDASAHADVRQLARELVLACERDREAERMLSLAVLQTHLDDAGIAPSWNVRMSLEDRIHDLLDLKNALPRGGGGVAPGGGSGVGRALGAAASRVSVADEDLKRHLDRWPLSCVREHWEIQPKR